MASFLGCLARLHTFDFCTHRNVLRRQGGWMSRIQGENMNMNDSNAFSSKCRSAVTLCRNTNLHNAVKSIAPAKLKILCTTKIFDDN